MLIIPEQQNAIAKIGDGKNVSLVASAGTGKSWIVNQVKTENTAIISPTGIAAINVGGVTAHSAFALPIGYPEEKDWERIKPEMRDIFGNHSSIDRIILDEAYMLLGYNLDIIDYKLKKIRKNKLPFGGIQVVASGDPAQLEPIVKKEERSLIERHYKSPFIFDSASYNFDVVELTQVVRQSDAEQIRLLQNIRCGEDVQDTLLAISSICKPYENIASTLHLCAYNADADNINHHWYKTIKGKSHTYVGKGNDKIYPVDKNLKLKIGAKVIICANCTEGSYVNGSRGTIADFRPDGVYVTLDGGDTVFVTEMTWEEHALASEDGKVVKTVKSRYTQLPIKFGWAISVHRSQGQTLESAAIHTGRGMFSAGQAYVAMSRVKDLRNLSFVNPITPKDVIVNKRVKEWLGGLK